MASALVERLAREMCIANGISPDAVNPISGEMMFTVHLSLAYVAVNAVRRDLLSAMEGLILPSMPDEIREHIQITTDFVRRYFDDVIGNGNG